MECVEAVVPPAEERRLAMLAHFLQIFSWFWGPLIIYILKRESRFVAFHAVQALIFQIVLLAGWLAAFAVWMALFFTEVIRQMGKSHGSQASPAVFFVLFPAVWGLMMVGWLLNTTLGIIFGIKASKGEWAKYPIIGRWARRLAG